MIVFISYNENLGSITRGEFSRLTLVRNHPNGDIGPSERDEALARIIALAVETIGLWMFDRQIALPREIFSCEKAGIL